MPRLVSCTSFTLKIRVKHNACPSLSGISNDAARTQHHLVGYNALCRGRGCLKSRVLLSLLNYRGDGIQLESYRVGLNHLPTRKSPGADAVLCVP